VTIHVGILGAGGISDTHARAAAAIPGVKVVAVHGHNAQKAERLAAANGAKAYADPEAFFAHKPMDMVAIGSPSGVHHRQIMACARASLHVLVEKPMTLTPEEADEAMAACQAAKVQLGVIFQDRLQPDVVRLRRFLTEGGLGRVHLVTADVKWYRPPEYYAQSQWRGRQSLDGGGTVINQGIHTLDLLLHLLGDVEAIFARTRTAAHVIEVEDTAVATLQFRSGALGTFESTTAAFPGYKRRVEISGDAGTVVFEHDRLVRADLRPGTPALEVSAATADAESASSPVVSDETPHRRVFEDFLDAIAKGRRPMCDGREGRRSLVLVQALYQSARWGALVTIPPTV
jgi:predicted dehydrogenase